MQSNKEQQFVIMNAIIKQLHDSTWGQGEQVPRNYLIAVYWHSHGEQKKTNKWEKWQIIEGLQN